jgi:hypothetical protein
MCTIKPKYKKKERKKCKVRNDLSALVALNEKESFTYIFLFIPSLQFLSLLNDSLDKQARQAANPMLYVSLICLTM